MRESTRSRNARRNHWDYIAPTRFRTGRNEMIYWKRKRSIAAWGVVRSRIAGSPAMHLRRPHPHYGYTLIELLLVILIILLVSAIALPAVLSALSHRQVSEAARLLQGVLIGARDSALR